MPFALLVSAWLAGDDDMLAVVFDCFAGDTIGGVIAVRVVGVFSIQCRARCCGVVPNGVVSFDCAEWRVAREILTAKVALVWRGCGTDKRSS